MKTASRILALVLTLALALSLVVSVSAATTYTVTINNTADGYTYAAYQIFAGDLDTTGTKLSNITWGAGITDAGKEALYTQLGLTDSADQTAAKVAEKLSAYANKSDEIKAISDIIGANLASTATATVSARTSTAADAKYEISDLTAGYYFIKNTAVPTDESFTDYILEVVKSTVIDPKVGKSTVIKEVKDVNDSTAEAAVWGDSADHDIGDAVEFRLTGTLADNYADYKDYYYSFEDTMAHLSYVTGSVQVMVGTTDITSWFTPTWDEASKTLTIKCADLKAADTSAILTKDSKIVVTYKATLDDDAVIGVKGNVNSVDLTYSNNPNATGAGNTTKTPDKTTTVFTFQLDVDKIAETATPGTYAPLAGAGFTLYKRNDSSSAADKFEAVGAEVKDVTSFTWKGLDAGTYKLVETTVPDGYNKMDDITFDVVATHDVDKVSELTVTAGTGLTASADGSATTTLKVDDSTKTIAAGHIFGEIENKEGSTLPSTGGAGTTMLYVVGGILVVFAGVFLILRKRMEKAEK